MAVKEESVMVKLTRDQCDMLTTLFSQMLPGMHLKLLQYQKAGGDVTKPNYKQLESNFNTFKSLFDDVDLKIHQNDWCMQEKCTFWEKQKAKEIRQKSQN